MKSIFIIFTVITASIACVSDAVIDSVFADRPHAEVEHLKSVKDQYCEEMLLWLIKEKPDTLLIKSKEYQKRPKTNIFSGFGN